MQKVFAITGVINYLAVVFLNAFTDLGHKIIIQNTIFKVYDGSEQIVLTAIVNALVLLPFILMFSPSGFLADRFRKNIIMTYSALFAVVITLFITLAYYQGWFLVAFGLTFLLAAQSAIYGPAKYGYIKELFGEKYISSGNGLVQAVTTVAILGGIIFYTVLFEGMYKQEYINEAEILRGLAPLGWLLVIGSVIELVLAMKLPTKIKNPSQRRFKFIKYIRGTYLQKNMKTITRKKEILEAIIALGLFWSISQVVLAVFGEYAKSELGVTNTIFVQGVMALAGVGIVIGSIMAANYSKYFINLGFAPLGALGITLLVSLIPFVHSMSTMAVMFSLFGVFSGFLMVPLNARIQILSPRSHLGIILAGNNFIQNIFMFSFLALTSVFAYYGMESIILFYLMALVGVYLSYLMLRRYSTSMFWAIMSLFASLRHSYSYEGLDNIPKNGGVLLLGNHVSWLDWIIVQLPLKRHINYMMEKEIYYWPVFHWFFAQGQAIPVSPKASKDAFHEAHKRLVNGHIVGVYPEGKLSEDGSIAKFYRGYELINKDYEGVIVPCFIDGLFGSMFSRYKMKPKKSFFKRRKVKVIFGTPVSKETTAEELRDIIIKMKEKHTRINKNETQ